MCDPRGLPGASGVSLLLQNASTHVPDTLLMPPKTGPSEERRIRQNWRHEGGDVGWQRATTRPPYGCGFGSWQKLGFAMASTEYTFCCDPKDGSYGLAGLKFGEQVMGYTQTCHSEMPAQ